MLSGASSRADGSTPKSGETVGLRSSSGGGMNAEWRSCYGAAAARHSSGMRVQPTAPSVEPSPFESGVRYTHYDVPL